MKKSIVTLGILALSIFNMNAKEASTTSGTKTEIGTTITRNQIVKVYDWSVNTDQGNYSGTTTSLEDAQKMIELSSIGEVILSKKIESFYQLANDVYNKSQRVFFWEVETSNGKAKGFSTSENQAKKMIELVSTGEVISFKIVKTGDY